MFVVPVFMIVLAVMYAVATYFLSRPKLRDEGLMSSPDYIGGALIETFLFTLVAALSMFIAMGLYNDIAAKQSDKFAALSTVEVWTVLTIIVLGAATPAYLFIRQLNKLKTIRQNL